MTPPDVSDAAVEAGARARELLAKTYEEAGQPGTAEIVRRQPYHPNSMRAIEIRAIERALTNPSEISGDQVVLVGYKNAAGEDCSAFLTASRIGQLLELTTPSDAGGDTPPNPGDARLRDGIRALADRWREVAHEFRYNPAAMTFTAEQVENCADELSSLLDGKGE